MTMKLLQFLTGFDILASLERAQPGNVSVLIRNAELRGKNQL